MSSRRSVHLNYNHLHYFHVAAVEGSVGGAAHQLGVTQPTISEQLRTLERALGVVLFERQSSGLRLTEAGRLAFKHTTVMFSAGERLAEELERGGEGAQPCTLRIGIASELARASGADLLTPLLGLGCVPSLRIGDYVELVRELRSSRLELLLCDREPPRSERRGFDVTLIERTMLAVVAPPGLSPSADWRELGLLTYRFGSPFRGDVDDFFAARGLRPRIAAEADDACFLLDAVAGGEHVAVVPRTLARDALAQGRLSQLDSFESKHVGLYALHQGGVDLVRRAVDRLVTHVRARDVVTG